MVEVAQKTVLHRMAELICDPESLRFSKPFHDGTGLFISDGAIVLSFGDIEPPEDLPCTRKRDGAWEIAEGHRRPPDRASEVVSQVVTGVLSFPVVEGPPNGLNLLWQKMEECPLCDGDGFCVCDMGHQHDCDDCGGAGEYLQEVDEADDVIEFVGGTFARRLLWIAAQLPNVKACPYMFGNMLGFTFDGGIGGLMQMKVEK